jgi:hypothetical protein
MNRRHFLSALPGAATAPLIRAGRVEPYAAFPEQSDGQLLARSAGVGKARGMEVGA